MSEETIILKLGPVVLGQDPPAEKKNETVSGFVLDAVRETCKQGTNTIVPIAGRPTFEGRSMVGLLTYCYTKGVLSAAEIEEILWHDDALRGKCMQQLPTAKTISRFRRLNRGLIQTCLENALRRIRRALASATLSQSISSTGEDTKPKAIPLSVAAAPGEGTTILMHKEAVQRIENATCLDADLLSG